MKDGIYRFSWSAAAELGIGKVTVFSGWDPLALNFSSAIGASLEMCRSDYLKRMYTSWIYSRDFTNLWQLVGDSFHYELVHEYIYIYIYRPIGY